MAKDEYWAIRNREMKHIQDMFDADEQYARALKRMYRTAQKNIEKEFESQLLNFATQNEISMAEARRRVDRMDVEAFGDKAKQYVREKNFSPQANQQLATYNVKMRMNRLDLLNANIRLETIALANEEEKLLTSRLIEEGMGEIERQSGILGATVPERETLNRYAKQIVQREYKGAHYSDRIWTRQTQMQNQLENSLASVLTSGRGVREAARDLREYVDDAVGGAEWKAERLMRTESARVQSGAALDTFEDNGIRLVGWIGEPGMCRICAQYEGGEYTLQEAREIAPPTPHANCRCSLYALSERRR